MTKKIREALKRIEIALPVHTFGSTSSNYAVFLQDIWTVVNHLKAEKRRKRV